MRKRIMVGLAGLALVAMAGASFGAVTKVSSKFDSSGNLVFYDKDGAAIFTVDGLTRGLTVASGATFTQNGSGDIARSSFAEEALQSYGIPISALAHTTGVPLTVAETAGGFNVSLSSHVWKAQAEIADNETEVSVTHFQFVLPVEYVAGGDISISLRCALIKTAAAVNNGSTVDVAVYKQADGAVGSDLSTTTSAATFAADDTWYTKTFVITPTGLTAGMTLNVEITTSVVDSEAGGGTLRFNMDPPKVLLDVKG